MNIKIDSNSHEPEGWFLDRFGPSVIWGVVVTPFFFLSITVAEYTDNLIDLWPGINPFVFMLAASAGAFGQILVNFVEQRRISRLTDQ